MERFDSQNYLILHYLIFCFKQYIYIIWLIKSDNNRDVINRSYYEALYSKNVKQFKLP